jgi:hypothetical protein
MVVGSITTAHAEACPGHIKFHAPKGDAAELPPGHIVFTTAPHGRFDYDPQGSIHISPLHSFSPSPIPNTTGATNLWLSDNGEWILYRQGALDAPAPLYVIRRDGSGKTRVPVDSTLNAGFVHHSPVYDNEIFYQPADSAGNPLDTLYGIEVTFDGSTVSFGATRRLLCGHAIPYNFRTGAWIARDRIFCLWGGYGPAAEACYTMPAGGTEPFECSYGCYEDTWFVGQQDRPSYQRTEPFGIMMSWDGAYVGNTPASDNQHPCLPYIPTKYAMEKYGAVIFPYRQPDYSTYASPVEYWLTDVSSVNWCPKPHRYRNYEHIDLPRWTNHPDYLLYRWWNDNTNANGVFVLHWPSNTWTMVTDTSTGIFTSSVYFSQYQNDTSPPTAPANLDAQSPASYLVTLQWDEAQDAQSGILSYTIYRDGTAIATTASAEYRDSTVTDNTSYTYRVAAKNGGFITGEKSNAASVSTGRDTQSPRIDSLRAGGYLRALNVIFDEPLDAASAADAGHYTIDNGISVEAAEVFPDHRTVLLTVSRLTAGQEYTLSVSGVTDRARVPNTVQSLQHTFTPEAALSLPDGYINDFLVCTDSAGRRYLPEGRKSTIIRRYCLSVDAFPRRDESFVIDDETYTWQRRQIQDSLWQADTSYYRRVCFFAINIISDVVQETYLAYRYDDELTVWHNGDELFTATGGSNSTELRTQKIFLNKGCNYFVFSLFQYADAEYLGVKFLDKSASGPLTSASYTLTPGVHTAIPTATRHASRGSRPAHAFTPTIRHAHGTLFIDVAHTGPLSCRLYRIDGRMISTHHAPRASRLSISTAQLAAGVYFLRVQRGDRHYSRRITIAR